VTGFLGQLVGVLPQTLWSETGSEDLLLAIVAAGCDAIVRPLHPSAEGGGSVHQPTQTAFEMFSTLADTLPPMLFLKTATCVMTMLLRGIESNMLNEVRPLRSVSALAQDFARISDSIRPNAAPPSGWCHCDMHC
jgi:hypothetical protein